MRSFMHVRRKWISSSAYGWEYRPSDQTVLAAVTGATAEAVQRSKSQQKCGYYRSPPVQ